MGIASSGLMFYPNMLESGVYLNSAHGNTSYGVNRIDTFNLGYSKGIAPIVMSSMPQSMDRNPTL